MKSTLLLLLCLLLVCPIANAFQKQQPTNGPDFDTQIAPLISSHCAECHHEQEPEGNLNLLSRASVLLGGENGPAVVPGQLQPSLLWQRVVDNEMPPETPLSEEQKQILQEWIATGAKWGTDPIDRFQYTTDKRAGYDWWALQPLQKTKPPATKNSQRIRNPIDQFVLARLEKENLSFSQDADPQTLIRRVYLDFHGLPPTPKQLETFISNPSDEAYQKVLTGLLDSPRYGERWGRHWLDIVRFGESDGFERNYPRKEFWHYRDWVISSLNADIPYNDFVRMQIAGDLLKPGSPEGFAAVGFLVAAVHNTVVGDSEMMKRQSRADEIEELVAAISQTFVGLTVNCARCHDHKFDPISQLEYFQLSAVVAGLNHGTRKFDRPDQLRKIQQFKSDLQSVNKQINETRANVRQQISEKRQPASLSTTNMEIPHPYASWEFEGNLQDSCGSLHGTAHGGAQVENGFLALNGKDGYVSTGPLPHEIREKTLAVLVQLHHLEQRGGGVISLETRDGEIFDSIVFGEKEPQHWMAGSNHFLRTRSFQGAQEDKAHLRPVHWGMVYHEDGTITGYRDGVRYGESYRTNFQTFPQEDAKLLFGLRHSAAGENGFLAGRILLAQLYDKALDQEEILAIAQDPYHYIPETKIVEFLHGQKQIDYLQLKQQQQHLQEKISQTTKATYFEMYTNVPTTPGETFFLHRGNVMDRGVAVAPGTIKGIANLSQDLRLAIDASDADRRQALANWLTSKHNALGSRVIVNRLWHYHFGFGIVDTPSDFGFNGGRPSHPALLDWLATQLIDNQTKLKEIHRLIASSTTYRQASHFRPLAAQVDADNRLMWRKSPSRCEGEIVRDSILSVSGQLDLSIGGPGFEDVTIKHNNGTTYYTPFDKADPVLNRRTVYRFTPRGERMTLLDVFDCPDPSAAAPRRSSTTTPLQALSLLNNAFVLRMANQTARRVEQEVGDDVEQQVNRTFLLALGRTAKKDESEFAISLVNRHGLALLARTLFNTNEFLIIP